MKESNHYCLRVWPRLFNI